MKKGRKQDASALSLFNRKSLLVAGILLAERIGSKLLRRDRVNEVDGVPVPVPVMDGDHVLALRLARAVPRLVEVGGLGNIVLAGLGVVERGSAVLGILAVEPGLNQFHAAEIIPEAELASALVGVVTDLEITPCAVAHVVELFPALVAGLDAAAILISDRRITVAAVLMRTIQKIPGGSVTPPPGTNQTNNYQYPSF